MHEPAPLEWYLNRLDGEVIADEQQGPFCQLCLQRGHPLIRCPLREGLMFLVCALAIDLIIIIL
jgi:hypothetical protein